MSAVLFARYELISLRRDRRAWAAGVCALVLLLAALSSSAQMRHAYEATRAEAQQASQRQWLTQGTKNPHSAAHFGVYAFRPLPALAPFEPGLHGTLGTTIYLEAHMANELRDAPDEDGARLTALDASAAYLARTVLPLLVFLLVAAVVAGERERGTLALLLAQGAPLSRVVLGKALAYGALLSLIVAAAALFAPLVAAVEPLRLVGLAAAYWAFALAALFAGIAVSVRVRDARMAVVVLFAVWAFSMVLGPRAAASIAAAVAPMPLRSVAQQALEHALDSEGYEARTNALRARMLAQYGVPHVEALPFNFRGLALQTDEERGYAIFDRHRARLRARERQQDAVLRAASFILPWLALEQASTALAGTDLRHAEHFADAAESYRRDLVGRMNGHLLHGSGADAGAELWATVPAFAYVTPSGRFALDYAWPCLAILCAWVAITFTVLSLLGQRTRVHGGAT